MSRDAFIAGLPLWTTLIALRTAGKPVVGVIAQPYLDEIFLGGPSGARFRPRGSRGSGTRARVASRSARSWEFAPAIGEDGIDGWGSLARTAV